MNCSKDLHGGGPCVIKVISIKLTCFTEVTNTHLLSHMQHSDTLCKSGRLRLC